MKTYNASIYHCVTCGHVKHDVLATGPPQCCGHTMAEAVTGTIRARDVAGKTAGDNSETAPPVIEDRNKPR